jgi:hypothetical protein
MRVLRVGSVRQPKGQRGRKGTATKRANRPKGHVTNAHALAHGPGVLCAAKRQTRTEQLGPSLRG